MEQNGVVDIQKGNLVKTFFDWGQYFHISLHVTITQTSNQKMNIFHFTTDDQSSKYPALWITHQNKFHFIYNVNGNSATFEYDFQLDQSYKLAIRKFAEDGVFKLQIAVDDNLVHETVDLPEDEVSSVKYYLSKPGSLAFTDEYGTVEDIMVISDESCEFEDASKGFVPPPPTSTTTAPTTTPNECPNGTTCVTIGPVDYCSCL